MSEETCAETLKEQANETLMFAASKGFLYVIQKFWILNEYIDGRMLLREAALHGHINVVKYLVEEESTSPGKYLDEMVKTAVSNGWSDLLEYYSKQSWCLKITLGLIELALRRNHPETAKVLFKILREIKEKYGEDYEDYEC